MQLKFPGLQVRAIYPVSHSKTAISPVPLPWLQAEQGRRPHPRPLSISRWTQASGAETAHTWQCTNPFEILGLHGFGPSSISGSSGPPLGARIFPAVVTNVVDSKLVSFLVHSLPILPTKPLFVVILLTWKRLASSHVRFTRSEKRAEWQWLFLHVLQMSSAC